MYADKIDEEFIQTHTVFAEGGGPWGAQKELTFDDFKKFLEDYTPEKVADLVGLSSEKIVQAARMFGRADKTMSLWTMGLNQRKWGTWVNNAVYNLHLLTGKLCSPGNTALSMTGQPNACGGVREQGMLSHLLPAHRLVKNAKHLLFGKILTCKGRALKLILDGINFGRNIKIQRIVIKKTFINQCIQKTSKDGGKILKVIHFLPLNKK